MRNIFKLKRSTKQLIIATLICFTVTVSAFGAAYFIYVKQIKVSYQTKLETANDKIKSNQRYAYVAKHDIKPSEEISKDNVEYTEVFSSLDTKNFITDKDFGKSAVIKISAGIPVIKDMVTGSKMDKDLREEEFNVFYLSSNLKEGDNVDIRLIYPNGEDYIVLSKKAVKNLNVENNNCFLWLNEEEILKISGAIVDAYLHEGCKLYTVKYIEPSIQEASQVTYTPNTDVINLIHSDPNVVQKATDNLRVEVREALDDRLTSFYQNYNGEVTWDNNSNNYYQDQDNGDVNSSDTESTESTETTEENSNESEDDIYYVD